jgi:hypothetical protein
MAPDVVKPRAAATASRELKVFNMSIPPISYGFGRADRGRLLLELLSRL